MAKDDAALKDAASEIDAILKDGKKKPLNFALMKAKEGVVMKAHPLKSADVMYRDAKGAGGMPAFSCMGVLNVVGKVMELSVTTDDVPRTLPKLAKKHFSSMGIKCKVVIVLPGGGRLEDEDEEGEDGDAAEVETEEVAPGVMAPVEEDPDANLAEELKERLKQLVPQVRGLIAQGAEGAEKLGKGLQAAGGEIANAAYDRAKQLIEAVEASLKQPGGTAPSGPEAPAVDADMLKEQLQSEYNAITSKVNAILDAGMGNTAGKLRQIVAMFETELERDLKKAGQVLGMMKKFVSVEFDKLAPQPKGDGGSLGDKILSGIGESMDKLGEKVNEVVEGVKEKVGEAAEYLSSTPEERKTREGLEALGLSLDERNALMEKLEKDPQAVDKFKKEKMKAAGVPEDRQAALLKMSVDNPKAFAAALASLGTMDPKGDVDTSPGKMQESLEAFEAARKLREAKLRELEAAQKSLDAAALKTNEAGTKVQGAKDTANKTAQAIKDLEARIGDPSKLTPEQRAEFVKESTRLINANEDAKKALEAARKEQEAAAKAEQDAKGKLDNATKAKDEANANFDVTKKENDAKEGKKALLDALSFGPLSAGGKFSDEDKASFAAAFGKNAKVANSAMGIAQASANPSAVAKNVGFVADKANDGFADATGKGLDLPEEDRNKMAENALRMGGQMGEDYFKGFGDYLKTGKQLAPDPYGGMGKPLADEKAETQRQNKIALGRSSAMGAAALKPDGTVDFESDAAKGAMDHMLFHPGSLTAFTPQMNAKMVETKGLFANSATKDKANQTIKDTKLPATTAPGRKAAETLVAGTTGKDKGAITDNDAKASVLGAMMTPLSQGPVGSCFSTAPVHAIRETDPLRAMGEYSKIATTGQFKAKDGSTYPANTHLPEGENPLMRSWEYSVATAAAERQNSIEKNNLRAGLMGAQAPGKNFGAIKGIVGNAAWANSNDPVTGAIVPGVESKLRSAISNELKFVYNAGPQVGGPAGGGGDGHSTDGAYEITYKGKALTSEADFLAAMKTIALGATGETEATPKGQAIATLVTSADFKNTILAANTNGYTPWKLSGGGFEKQTAMVLDGGALSNQDVLVPDTSVPPKTEGQRTKDVIGAVLTAHKTMGKDLSPLGTTGTDANHAFNTMPNHPSLDKIKDPDSDAKIQKELIDPGVKIASTKLPVGQAARMFEDQLKAMMNGAPDTERDLLVQALKNRPTTEMTPAEVKAKVTAELGAYRDAAAQRKADEWIKTEDAKRQAAGTALLTNTQKGNVLAFFKTQVEDGVKAEMDTKLMKELAPPEVVIADSNWGGPGEQIYFVAAADPTTGELKMWRKTMPDGKMTPLGKNWADASWDTVK